MGRKLTGNFEKTPIVNWRDGINKVFQGRLLAEGREVGEGKKRKVVFEFAVEDGDINFQKSNETGEYVNVDVAVGDRVSYFAPTALERALSGAKVGESIKIQYLGKEFSPKSGQEYHSFDAEVI